MDLLNPMLASPAAGWLAFYEGRERKLFSFISHSHKNVQGNFLRIFGSKKKVFVKYVVMQVIILL